MRLGLGYAVALLATLALPMAEAGAGIVTLGFSGAVNSLRYNTLPGVALGDRFTASATYDSDVLSRAYPASGPDLYLSPILTAGARLPAAGIDATGPSPTGGQIVVERADYDSYMVVGDLETGLPPGYLYVTWTVEFADYDGRALNSKQPPLDLLQVLLEFDATSFYVVGTRVAGFDDRGRDCSLAPCYFELPLTLDRVTLTTVDVPEPGSLALFGTALCGLALLGLRAGARRAIG